MHDGFALAVITTAGVTEVVTTIVIALEVAVAVLGHVTFVVMIQVMIAPLAMVAGV